MLQGPDQRSIMEEVVPRHAREAQVRGNPEGGELDPAEEFFRFILHR